MVLSIQEKYEMSVRFESIEQASFYQKDGYSIVTDNNETFYLVKETNVDPLSRLGYNKVT
jgi:metal-dependent HD superfamily phosphatase/phosphodiesterase